MFRSEYEYLKLYDLEQKQITKACEKYRLTHFTPEEKWYLRIPRKLRRIRVQ